MFLITLGPPIENFPDKDTSPFPDLSTFCAGKHLNAILYGTKIIFFGNKKGAITPKYIYSVLFQTNRD